MFTRKTLIENPDNNITLEITASNVHHGTAKLFIRTFKLDPQTLQSLIANVDELETDEATQVLIIKMIKMVDPQKQHGPHDRHSVMWDEIEHALKLFTQF